MPDANHDVLTADRPTSVRSDHYAAAVVGCVLFAILASLALTVDVPRIQPTFEGDIKSDEATYVAATLSLAYDGDLVFQRRDLERFAGFYHRGPEGIFLKRGKTLDIQRAHQFPYVRIVRFPQTGQPDRLHFGKALIYPIAAAPFVRMFGMNGFFVFHVLLLTAVAICGYLFLVAQMSSLTAALFTSAFLGASALPFYSVFLAPELFNFALAFVAFFLWLYKEVSPTRAFNRSSDVFAAVLLGLIAYSKPTNGLLIVPLIVYAWWRRRWSHGFLVGTAFVVVVALCFGLTLSITGELNYQGGDRKTFYGSFPGDGRPNGWDRGIGVATDGTAVREVLTNAELPARFATNVKYFLIGRHFGLVPYGFPGVVAISLWLFSRTRRVSWRVLTFLTAVASAVALLLLTPYTWSGAGGPIGNRYFLASYAVLFFLIPPLNTPGTAVLAWIGGALFTAKILVNPFTAAKYPYLMTERGAARWLPVELAMGPDLPVAIAQPIRARIPYGHDPTMLLYFLDQNASPPEPPGMWVAGGRRADILIRARVPVESLSVTAESPIPTTVELSLGAQRVSIALQPGTLATLRVPARGTRERYGYAYLFSVSSSSAFVPHLHDPASNDYRNLGVLLNFSAVPIGGGQK